MASIHAGAQNVYQVQNADFEGSWDDVTYSSKTGVEPAHWNSFLTGTGSLKGTAAASQVEKSAEVRPGSAGTSSVKITDRKVIFSIYAQGNITTGCINMGSMTASDASGNYNYTDTSNSDFNQPFTGRPDSMTVWVKYVSTKSYVAKANTILHTSGYYQDPEAGDITATVIAKAENVEIASNEAWQRLSIPFVYTDEGSYMRPNYALVSFATNATPGKGTGKDYMLIDDLAYVYNSELATATYNGESLTIPAAGDITDCSTLVYEESKFACTHNAVSGEVLKEYDEATGVLTVTVKGDDWSVSGNQHVYKFQFEKPVAPASLASLSICGEAFSGLQAGVTEYTLPYVYNAGLVFEPVAAEGSELVLNEEGKSATHDYAAKTVSVAAKNSKEEVTTYVFRFTDAVASAESGDYAGSLSVELTTSDNQATRMPLSNATIQLTANSNGTVNLALNDFAFAGIPVGDIFVPNLPLAEGKVAGTKTIYLTDFDEQGNPVQGFGSMLGALPVKVEATLLNTTDKEATASIDILTESSPALASMFKGIHVDFVPFAVDAKEALSDGYAGRAYYPYIQATGRVTKDAAKYLQINNSYVNTEGEQRNLPMTYVDLSGATLDADVTLADIMAGAPEANNTLVYVAEGTGVNGDNVVTGNKAATLKLTDGIVFGASKEFTAATVDYNREFEVGEEAAASVVFPFAIEASQLAGKTCKFAGRKDDALNFESVQGRLEANTPYLILPAEAKPLARVADAAVAVTPQEEMAVTVDGFKHLGSFSTLELATDPAPVCYDYKGTEFVKVSENAINPFRALIVSEEEALPEVFKLTVDGVLLGIVNVNANDAVVDVYSLDGKLVRSQVNAATSLQGLPRGIYVVGGKKVVK